MLICILKGGLSNEREISLQSAETYTKACKNLGHDVFELDTNIPLVEIVKELDTKKPDLVVNALHGKYGEDGRIQSVLDMMEIPYTHSGTMTSAVFMNKHVTKIIAAQIGLKTPPYTVTKIKDINPNTKRPFVIKPIDDGSSIGVNIVFETSDMHEIISKYNQKDLIIVEDYIKGTEVTVGIINGTPIAVTEIRNKNLFYDFEAKYSEKNASVHILPAEISSEMYEKAMQATTKLYEAMNARGPARADFIISDKENELYFIEMNSQPGMTEHSLVPEQAKYAFGWDSTELVKKILETATFDK